VQFAVAVSVQAQWAKQSAEIKLSAPSFRTGALRATKFVHHLQSKKLLLFLPSEIAQSVDFQPVAIATIHLRQL
jgi:hypothetical protein